MTKIFTLFFAAAFTTAAMAQVTVPEVTKAVYNKKTASWCAPCYEWGIGVDDNIISQAGDKAVSFKLTASASGNQYLSECADMYNAYDNQGHTGWPNFFVNAFNETDYVGGGISPSGTTSNCTGSINSFYSATTADVNAGFEVTYTGDSIHVETTCKFFNAMNGNYYMGVYILEDDVTYQQNTDGGYVALTADKFMRASIAGTGAFGVQVGSGAVTAGTEINGSYSVEIDNAWNAGHCRVITVIWENLGGGNYTVINANDVASASQSTGINENDIANEITVYPNPASNEVFVDLNALEDVKGINLYNALGQEVLVSNAPINNGIATFDVSALDNGMYYMHIMYADQKVVKKFIKK